MIHIFLNHKKVACKEGQTLLEVAREHGIHIPTLCHETELNAYGSCWVCSVKVEGVSGFVTSCGTAVRDGMSVITDSEEVRKARKTALELLLSDHYADCEAPCKTACPDHVDIQTYVSLIANGQFREAVAVIKRDLPLPMSVGRICPAFCEEECRRKLVDESVAIRQLKRCAADLELEDWEYVPERKEAKGKKVAVIGAGPAGLTCGYYLSIEGYQVDVFESMPQAGGWAALRHPGIPSSQDGAGPEDPDHVQQRDAYSLREKAGKRYFSTGP
ncbi:MAG: 2Fe-2S iron-sulfur cluster-binding protein [Candidatus Marinimicrobia bacterium]|nr:2Fe-2S iron-sulfur cluster-binding protein [Candidatus Neomarinimicrobiota bacterium]